MKMGYVLGIDQGSSKTHAIVADEAGHILGLGCEDGACHSSDGMSRAMTAIRSAVQQAMDAAGVRLEQLDRIAAGLTGVDWPHEKPLLQGALSETLGVAAERINVVNDCLIALRAGTSRPSGVILCAGSGLNCAIRHADGREYAYGFYIADDCQGGTALGLRVLQAVFDAESGVKEQTALTPMALNHFGCSTVDELLYRRVTGAMSGKQIRQLVPLLDEAALTGDRAACMLLQDYGRDIARYATAALAKFDMLTEETEVVLSGSVFKCRAPQLVEAVRESILCCASRAVILESVYEPVIGAALLALDDLEGSDAGVIAQNIAVDAKEYRMLRKG